MKKDNPEGMLQLQIIHLLKRLGYVVGKTRTMGVKRFGRFCYDPYTFRGFPDLVAFGKDRLFFIEVKSPKGVQSDDQKKFQELVESMKCPQLVYVLARGVDKVLQSIQED